MKRINVLVAVLALFAVVSLAQAADFWIEGSATHSNGKNGSSVVGGVDGNLDGAFGYYAFGQASSDGYRQVYGGPKWTPTSWLEVGVGIGIENLPSSIRRNAYAAVNYEKLSVYGTFENGGSGPWHKVTMTYKATDIIGVGVIDQSFFGFGPRIEYKIKKNVMLWGAVARDHDTGEINSKLAITFSF